MASAAAAAEPFWLQSTIDWLARDFVFTEWPLSSAVGPAVGSVGYLVLVFALQRVMASRNRIDFPRFALFHNALLVVLSAANVFLMVHETIRFAYREGPFELFCEHKPQGYNLRGPFGFCVYFYYITKYYELIDTYLQVFLKKRISFLHLYHHSMMLWVPWIWLHYELVPAVWYCIAVNSTVHVFMYYYYAQAGRGVNIWWKEYLTVGQLVQFSGGWLLMWFWFAVRNSSGCTGDLYSAIFSHTANTFIMYLFGKFYYDTYKSGSKPQRDIGAGKAKTAAGGKAAASGGKATKLQ